jgi:HK97 family phage prohead protease
MERENKIQLINKEYKSNVSEVNQEGEKGIVGIYVSGFGNIDSDRDIMNPKAFNYTIQHNFKRIKHLKDHNYHVLLGLPLEFKPDEKGLFVKSAMNLEKPIVREVYSDYKFFKKHDRTIEHSITFSVSPDKIEYNKDNNTRTINEVKLYEYSTLSFLGANENTPLVDIKSLSTEIYDYSEMSDRLKNIETILTTIDKNYASVLNLTPKEVEITKDSNLELLHEFLKRLKSI